MFNCILDCPHTNPSVEAVTMATLPARRSAIGALAAVRDCGRERRHNRQKEEPTADVALSFLFQTWISHALLLTVIDRMEVPKRNTAGDLVADKPFYTQVSSASAAPRFAFGGQKASK